MTVLWQAYRRAVEALYRLRHRVHDAVIQYIAAGGEVPMPPPRPSPHPPNAHEPVSHAQLNDRLGHYVTHGDIDHRLHSIDRHLIAVEEIVTQLGETIVSSAQDVINAVAAELQQEESDLNAAVAAIQAWIAAQPASVDVSALQPLADQLKASVAATAALVPAPPAGP